MKRIYSGPLLISLLLGAGVAAYISFSNQKGVVGDKIENASQEKAPTPGQKQIDSQTSKSASVAKRDAAPSSNADLDRLSKLPLVDEKSWNDPRNGQALTGIQIRDESSRYPDQIIVQNKESGQRWRIVANHFLATFKEAPSPAEIAALEAQYGLGKSLNLGVQTTYQLNFKTLPLEQRLELENKLLNDHRIASLSDNPFTYPTAALTNDIYIASQWSIDNSATGVYASLSTTPGVDGIDSKVGKAWRYNTDCSSIGIAVLDSGVLTTHPDLVDNLDLSLARNFSTEDSKDIIDTHGHGTHVTGIIGAKGNNSIGVSGVCQKARMIPIRIIDGSGKSIVSYSISALNYAALALDVKIINMSVEVPVFVQAFHDAVKANTDRGRIIFGGAANDGTDNDVLPHYPAGFNIPGVVSVGSYTHEGVLSDFSNYGAKSVDIAAPGSNIFSTSKDGIYVGMSGTSMATPYATGAAALLWSMHPKLTASQVINAMLSSADKGNFSKPITGDRRLNAERMFYAVLPKFTVKIDAKTGVEFSAAGGDVDIKSASLVIKGLSALTLSATDTSSTLAGPAAIDPSELSIDVITKEGEVRKLSSSDFEIIGGGGVQFSQVKLEAKAGADNCIISKGVAAAWQTLQAFHFDSKNACDRVCSAVLPLVESSGSKANCQFLTDF